MAENCSQCGKELTFRDSFVFCIRCLLDRSVYCIRSCRLVY